MEQLQDCFATTDWSVFESKDLEQYTASVLGYITHCMDTVTRDKRIRMTKEVQCQGHSLQERRSGALQYRQSQPEERNQEG